MMKFIVIIIILIISLILIFWYWNQETFIERDTKEILTKDVTYIKRVKNINLSEPATYKILLPDIERSYGEKDSRLIISLDTSEEILQKSNTGYIVAVKKDNIKKSFKYPLEFLQTEIRSNGKAIFTFRSEGGNYLSLDFLIAKGSVLTGSLQIKLYSSRAIHDSINIEKVTY